MKHLTILISLFAFVALPLSAAEKSDGPWTQQISHFVNLLGHRNMIIVADSAYPIQIGGGVKVIATSADHLEVVKAVSEAIGKSNAVRPLIALDKEFAFVPEKYAPGAAKLRESILATVDGKSALAVREVLHEDLLKEVSKLAETYQVIVFKTTGTIPYSSVFFTLDCGYWSAEAEAALREKMK